MQTLLYLCICISKPTQRDLPRPQFSLAIYGHTFFFFSFLLGILFATPCHRFDLYYSFWDVVHLYSERKLVCVLLLSTPDVFTCQYSVSLSCCPFHFSNHKAKLMAIIYFSL